MGKKNEGFLGSVIAVEGITDASALMYGPDGYRMVVRDDSNKYYPRPTERVERAVPLRRENQRLPCNGAESPDTETSAERLTEALEKVCSEGTGLAAVVCSPGYSISDEAFAEASGNSGTDAILIDPGTADRPLNEGLDLTTVEILRKLVPRRKERAKGRINILGVNILTKDWQKVEEEFSKIFSLMGLEVSCFLSAGCTLEQIRDSASAELNVVLCPDYVRETCRYYSEVLGITSAELPCSAVGFDCTDELIRMTADATGADPTAALEYVAEFRRRAFGLMDNMRLRLRGKTFDLEAEPSLVLSLVRILQEDLDLVPLRVAFNGSSNDEAKTMVTAYLESKGMSEVLAREKSLFPDYMLADGNKAWIYETTGRCGRAIDLGYPSENCHCFRNSSVLGPSGMMYLLDRIVMPKGY